MKHTGHAASLRPAREAARVRQRQPGRPSPTTRAGRLPREQSSAWIGAWRLDVDNDGQLIAINEDTGTIRVLATTNNDGRL